MGKQINFYMNEETENRFLDYCSIFCLLYAEVDDKIKLIDNSEAKRRFTFRIYLYSEQSGDIVIKSNEKTKCESIDAAKSTVMQFIYTKINVERKILTRGSLWVGTEYRNESGEYIKKPDEFIKLYSKFVRWIKKNVPYRHVPVELSRHKYMEYINDSLFDLIINKRYQHFY